MNPAAGVVSEAARQTHSYRLIYGAPRTIGYEITTREGQVRGLTIEGDVVKRAAPTILQLTGMTLPQVVTYCGKRGWEIRRCT